MGCRCLYITHTHSRYIFLEFVKNHIFFLDFGVNLPYIMSMNWQKLYKVALERIKGLNNEVKLLRSILHSYLPILEKDDNEKR
jgi:hypothetical protein